MPNRPMTPWMMKTLVWKNVSKTGIKLPYFLTLSYEKSVRLGSWMMTSAMYLFSVALTVILVMPAVNGWWGSYPGLLVMWLVAFIAFVAPATALKEPDSLIVKNVDYILEYNAKHFVRWNTLSVDIYTDLKDDFMYTHASKVRLNIDAFNAHQIQWVEKMWEKAVEKEMAELHQDNELLKLVNVGSD